MKRWRRWMRGGVAVLALGAARAALARGGGGGHSGGGGGHASASHSGFSHSSSGGGMSLGGFITLLILALIIWLIWRRVRRRLGPVVNQLLAANPQLSGAMAGQPFRPTLPPAIETIRAQDPGFELETFLQRAEMSFFLVKRGIQRNEPAAVRPYLNDAMFAQISQFIGTTVAAHRHVLFESLNVRAVHLDDATCTDQGQTLQIHFDLVYRAKNLDDSNRVLADEGQDRRRGERWTFVRAANARTPSTGDVTAARCPACGAELRLNLDGTCAHCRASVTNGSIDWVVADIQPAAFVGLPFDSQMAAAAPTLAEGVARLQGADAAFSVDAFRVRVGTAFSALQQAWCQQNVDAARAFMSPGAYFAWRSQLETMAAEGRRNIMEQLQVLTIQPLRVVHGRVFDDLTVAITASCADYEVDQSGRVVFGDRAVRAFTEEWTFQRSVGVVTTNKPGTLENTCPNCGAPVALTQIGECRYCKAAVTSGKFDWVVSRIEQPEED
jgi:predicted lipid-binding transport protein (Tim44 family)